MAMTSDQHGNPTVEHRVCYVGLVDDDGYALDASSRFDCFKVRGEWSIGPARELADLGEWLGWAEEHGDSGSFEMAYALVLEYLTASDVESRMLNIHDREHDVAVWCEDETEKHDRYVPRYVEVAE